MAKGSKTRAAQKRSAATRSGTERVITGTVRQAGNGAPAPGLTVSAIDHGSSGRILRAQATTGRRGEYRFSYRPKGTPPSELVVRVVDQEGIEIGRSIVTNPARSPLTVDLTIDLRLAGETDIDLLQKGVPGVDPEQLRRFAAAGELERATGIPAVIGFALGQADLPLDLHALATLPADHLTTAIDQAVRRREIPVSAELALPAVISRLGRHRVDSTPIVASATALGETLTPKLVARLKARGIHTLADVRKIGGLSQNAELSSTGAGKSLEAIDAHAVLAVLTGDTERAAALARAGLRSLADVAATSEARLAKLLGDESSTDQVVAIRQRASTLIRLAIGQVVRGRLDQSADLADRTSLAFALNQVEPPRCGCDRCREATSPIAYFVDLLDYTVRHLRDNDQAITIPWLEQRFRQPFSTLPADCAALDQRVRQVRIAIEVLRKELGGPAGAGLPPNYLDRAYRALLDGAGIPYQVLVDARSVADPKRRNAMAASVGLFVSPTVVGRPDILDLLFQVPTAITEDWLETTFGLPSTNRDSLAPLGPSRLEDERRRFLRMQWRDQDWPVVDPPTATPLVDPDIVGPADFVDGLPSQPGRVGAARPMDLWEDRVRDGAVLRSRYQETRVHPQGGLNALLEDRSQVGVALALGTIGRSIADLQAIGPLASDQDLATLHLERAELVRILQLIAVGEPNLSDLEWNELYDILYQRTKRELFPAWRAAEKALGLVVGPDRFRIRQPFSDLGDPLWGPTPWRSDRAVRRNWEELLAARTAQDLEVGVGVRATVDEVEGELLVSVRDQLRIAFLNRPSALRRTATQLTRRLQIDVETGACAITTRIAQAIETLQGVLFGARTGLLDDPSLSLDAPYFDQEWPWIGSFPNWRAAMMVFLYPEGALRPSFRRRQSPASRDLLARAQGVGTIDEDQAFDLVHEYERYFADVCSLVHQGFVQTRGPFPDDLDPLPASAAVPYSVILARAANSGRFYYCVDQAVPWYGYIGGPTQTFWRPIAALDDAKAIVGLLPFRTSGSGQLQLGIYAQLPEDAAEPIRFLTADGTIISEAVTLPGIPGMVRSADLGIGPIAADGPQVTGALPVTANDTWISIDLDGDGRKEILVIAATPRNDGTGRDLAVLREQLGSLVLSSVGILLTGWQLVPGRPVVLRGRLTQSPDRRVETVLLTVQGAGGRAELGTLGLTAAGAPGLVWQTTDGAVHQPNNGPVGWTIDLTSPTPVGPDYIREEFGGFVAVDLYGDGRTELLALHHHTDPQGVTSYGGHSKSITTVQVLRVEDLGLTWQRSAVVEFDVWGTGASTTIPDDFSEENWRDPIGLGRAFLGRGIRRYFPPGGGEVPERPWVGPLRWDQVNGGFELAQAIRNYPIATAPLVNLNADRFLAIRLDATSSTRSILLTQSTSARIALLSINPAGTFDRRWDSTGEILARNQTDPSWQFAATDALTIVDLDGDGLDELVLLSASGAMAIADWRDGRLGIRWQSNSGVPNPTGGGGWVPATGTIMVAGDIDGDGLEELVVRSPVPGGACRLDILRAVPRTTPGYLGGYSRSYGPRHPHPVPIEPWRSAAQTQERRNLLGPAWPIIPGIAVHPWIKYLEEAYHFVPLEIGIRLREGGYYRAALDWLRSLYDYDAPSAVRRISPLIQYDDGPIDFAREAMWLLDPLDPHRIAATRPNSHTRYLLLEIIRCLLEYADVEYTRATAESLPRARALYLKALELLDEPAMTQHADDCSDLLGELVLTAGDDVLTSHWRDFADRLRDVTSRSLMAEAVGRLQELSGQTIDSAAKVLHGNAIVEDILRRDRAQRAGTVGARLESATAGERAIALRVIDDANAAEMIWADFGRNGRIEFVPAPRFGFCIPFNPAIQWARDHATLCLRKLRSCRDISGAELRVEPYEAGTATGPTADGQDSMGQGLQMQPLPYRYATLVDRAKQLIQLAQQLEASLLANLAAADQARYDELKARQDLGLARASIRLKDLQINQAQDGIGAAVLQRDRATVTEGHYQTLINNGWSWAEEAAFAHLNSAAVHQHAAAGGAWAGIWSFEGIFRGAGAVGEALGATATAWSLTSQIHSQLASFERREEEWRFQRSLAAQDVLIGQQQIQIAMDTAAIVRQERVIASLQTSQAETILDYLVNQRFLNSRVYEWMAGTLEQIYRFFLQQATSAARLAELQLAFERQELPHGFIRSDYWTPPRQEPQPTTDGANLHGLTGSARLLRDIYQMDQYAFGTDQRKLQLQQSISLARLDPLAFEQFRETGLLSFATPSALFDREFPGHYLRLVRRAKVSVVALVPPTQGIRATLSTVGTSRAVVVRDGFRSVGIQRGPERIAFTSPAGATGMFELDPQPELVMPFEGIGVDATWELRMPRPANQFDYGTIADVILTLEYTALDSPDYRSHVIGTLDRDLVADRAFSFRTHFADAWYDLHNPDLATPPPMTVSFETVISDFAPNGDKPVVRQLTLYFVRADGQPMALRVDGIGFTPQGGAGITSAAAATTAPDGVLSTRRGNWPFLLGAQAPTAVGKWELSLGSLQTRFAAREFTDLVFIIGYSARLPAWPV